MAKQKAKKNVQSYLGKSGPDFQKKKTKVGRKAIAENATNTSFATRSINLRTQLQRDDDELVNERGQGLKDLSAKCSHHNAHTRADSLQGFVQLIELHPAVVEQPSSVLRILEATLRLVNDDHAPVRRALAQLLHLLAHQVPRALLQPFRELIVAQTVIAMTSLNHDVRYDALDTVALWLEFLDLSPEARRQLANQLLLMISSETQSSSGQLTRAIGTAPNSRLAKQKTRIRVLGLVQQALQLDASPSVTTPPSQARQPTAAGQRLGLGGSFVRKAAEILTVSNGSAPTDHAVDPSLLAVLDGTWRELVGDGELDADSDLSSLQAMIILVSIIRVVAKDTRLKTAEETDMLHSLCAELLHHLPMAPLAIVEGTVAPASQTALLDINLGLMELAAAFPGDDFYLVANQGAHVLLTQLLEAAATVPRVLELLTARIERLGIRFKQLMTDTRDGALLRAYIAFSQQLEPGSAISLFVDGQLTEWLLSVELDTATAQMVASLWLVELPKRLWQMGAKHLDATGQLLNMLILVLQRLDTGEEAAATALTRLAGRYAAYFCAARRGSHVLGPFRKLPANLQHQAMDLVLHLLPFDAKLLAEVERAILALNQ
ncbi:uncharacterized protein MONBRDRAFT_38094, partial [Monosiga brevicollis MX1]